MLQKTPTSCILTTLFIDGNQVQSWKPKLHQPTPHSLLDSQKKNYSKPWTKKQLKTLVIIYVCHGDDTKTTDLSFGTGKKTNQHIFEIFLRGCQRQNPAKSKIYVVYADFIVYFFTFCGSKYRPFYKFIFLVQHIFLN